MKEALGRPGVILLFLAASVAAFVVLKINGEESVGLAVLIVAGTVSVLLALRATQEHMYEIESRMKTRHEGLSRRVFNLPKQVTANAHSLSVLERRFPHLSLAMSVGSMEASNLRLLLNLLDELKPNKIVELGCGVSTELIAAWLAEQGKGTLIAIDHSGYWAETCARKVARHQIGSRAKICLAPLTETTVLGERTEWYDLSKCNEDFSGVGLLVVDAPPADETPLARLPALPVFEPNLDPRAVVLLDDGFRPGERLVARKWEEAFKDWKSELHLTATGCWTFRRREQAQ